MNFKDLFSLQGKTCLVTGGAGYFGKLFVRGLLDAGAKTVVIVEKPGAGQEVKDKLIKEFPDRIDWYEADLYDREATDKVYDKILSKYRLVDVLINNAFEFSPRTGFEKGVTVDNILKKATHEQMLLSFESGVYWAFQATQKFGQVMKENNNGSIINIASPYGVIAPSPLTYKGFEHSPNPPGYGMAKSALLGLTRYCASFLAPVRVNALLPGAIPNPEESHERAGKSYKDEFLDRLSERMMLGRFGRPDELVGPLIFLASDASSYVTSHALMVEGGWVNI